MKKAYRNRRLIEGRVTGTWLVKAVEDIQKTEFATSRLLYILEEYEKEQADVLYITPNKEARDLVQALYERKKTPRNISLFETDNVQGKAVIKEVGELLREASQVESLQYIDTLPVETIKEAVKEVRKCYPRVKFLGKSYIDFLCMELSWIRACGIKTLEEYRQAGRKGNPVKLSKRGKTKAAIWELLLQVEKLLRDQNYKTKEKGYLELLEQLKEVSSTTYRYIIIDDAQLFTKTQLEIIRYLSAGDDKSSIMFLLNPTAEVAQNSWLIKGRTFKTIGYNMTGKVKTLKCTKKVSDHRVKQVKGQLTPLEAFIAYELPKLNSLRTTEKVLQDKAPNIGSLVVSKPWYMETYEYINHKTGVKTEFNIDISAGEVFIEEELQSEDELAQLPLYSDIAAGEPIEVVDELMGEFRMPSHLIGSTKNTYMLHVQGDSMIGVGVEDGDYVVINAGAVGRHEIAAVYYNGATTLKRIEQDEDRILLVSENPKYKPIVIEDGDFRVMGRLVGVLKKK